jgi:hypothetical protein
MRVRRSWTEVRSLHENFDSWEAGLKASSTKEIRYGT